MRRVTLAVGHRPATERSGRVPDRARRRVISGLRSVARRSGQDGRRRRADVLLCGRAALVRSELLELAALLDAAPAPDPRAVADLHTLLTDGCASPLYNPDVHVSELRATLYYARCRLV